MNLLREPVDAGRLVRDAVELNSSLAGAQSLDLRCSGTEEILTIVADRDRILQVLSNLIENTIKFTPEGGRIDLSLRRDGDFVTFIVADTGAGIAPEELADLFQPFWQAKRSSGQDANRDHAVLALAAAGRQSAADAARQQQRALGREVPAAVGLLRRRCSGTAVLRVLAGPQEGPSPV